MASVHILVGTVMGTSLEVAQALGQTLQQLGHNVRVNSTFRKAHLQENPAEILLVCTSNTGMGDLPQNILPFFRHLVVDCPNLQNRHFGLINLGDSSYPNFAEAGKTIAEALEDLGAKRLGDMLIIDAIYDSNPQNKALEWLADWVKYL
jgi:MioC protein